MIWFKSLYVAGVSIKEMIKHHLPTRVAAGIGGYLVRWEQYVAKSTPFTPILGLSRSALALGTLLTLVATPLDQLFFKSANYPKGVVCDGSVGSLSLFCLGNGDYLVASRLVAITILLVVIIGVAPRISGLFHWWVSWSFYTSSPIPDGGDHVAGALTLLLIPLLINDRRLSHWHLDRNYEKRSLMSKSFAHAFLVLTWIQVAIIYAQAAMAKFGVEEWANGTAIWYWIQEVNFVPAAPVLAILKAWTSSFVGVVLVTYGSLALEFALMLGIFAPARIRGPLWLAGLSFHLAIGVVFGLWSFFFSMFAALTLYLIRPRLAIAYKEGTTLGILSNQVSVSQ